MKHFWRMFLQNSEYTSEAGIVAQQAIPPPCVWCKNLQWALVYVPVAPLSIQLSAWEGRGGWPKTLNPAPTGKTERSSWLLPTDGLSFGCHNHLERETAEGFLCLSFPLCKICFLNLSKANL